MVPSGIRSEEPVSSPKKPYKKPTLVEYGSVAKLTQGGGSIPHIDGNSGMTMPTK
ncbi:lasso RiPP family leader peptide-containing protein [bacterium]|nr:lasso RiPP family leader peptide-containing protein [bacterium]